MAIKYIFVTGGNVSSLGKGIAAASLGRLLKTRGLRVCIQKLDPYLNVDPGTMNPFEHGEVFVTFDGAETDLDLGHYERFVDISLKKHANVTTGQVYKEVIEKERRGEFLGGTVQVIPHITDEIKRRIRLAAESMDGEVAIVEVGGTVGDIESLPFLEAIRQLRNEVGSENAMNIHLTLIPYLGTSGELKTKLTQHSVMQLRGIGIQPDLILCRTAKKIDDSVRKKISLFCNVPENCVIEGRDVNNIYRIPLVLNNEGMAQRVVDRLNLKTENYDLSEWSEMVESMERPHTSCRVGLVGKYTAYKDSYISVLESIRHAGAKLRAKVDVQLIDAETLEEGDFMDSLDAHDFDGIVVTGGFGSRGVEGKINAATWCRKRNVPYLGLCLGLQTAVIDFARNVAGLEGAHSSEVDPDSPHPVIDLMLKQRGIKDLGGTMRLGHYDCRITEGTLAHDVFGQLDIKERHRHRWEVNNDYRERLIKAGMRTSGVNPVEDLVEIIELPEHRFFLACQFHPEFQSRPTRPHPMFRSWVQASLDYRHGEDRKED